jgi:SAM-dependent methyltransferase
MTVICFLDDVVAVFREVNRVLIPGGIFIFGFIEEGGEIQRIYQHESTKGRFLQFAKFRRLQRWTNFSRMQVLSRCLLLKEPADFVL